MAPLQVEVGDKYEDLWDEIRRLGYVRMRVDGVTPTRSMGPRRLTAAGSISRSGGRSHCRQSGWAFARRSIETALALGKGVLHVAVARDDLPEAKWETEIHSQHFACDRCGRSFEPLTPHSFSFNSWLGWCPACEGLGVEQGANLAVLVSQPRRTLADGVAGPLAGLDRPLARTMLTVLAAHTGMVLDAPFDELNAKHRRTLLYGTGEEWIEVPRPACARKMPASGSVFNIRDFIRPSTRPRECRPVSARGWNIWSTKFPVRFACGRFATTRRQSACGTVPSTNCVACRWVISLPGSTLGSRLAAIARSRRIDPRSSQSPDVSRRRRARLSRRWSARADLVGRRGAAHPPGQPGGEWFDRRAIRARRTDHRSASARDCSLLARLKKLRDLGNTLLLVEHDREVVASADQLLDFGPGAGDMADKLSLAARRPKSPSARDR